MNNSEVVFKQRPGSNGVPSVDHFQVRKCPYPSDQLKSGEVLVKNMFLSVDPAQRCQMNESTGVDYVQPWKLGEGIQGLGGVGMVVESRNDKFQKNDIVSAFMGWPWKKFFVVDGSILEKVDQGVTGDRPSLVLSCLGLIGLTSLLGIREKGHVVPGSTCVVSGAAGACGTLAGQIAKLDGCGRIVGICGSDEKCRFLLQELGFNSAINYKKATFEKELANACPKGVQLYFDNVGGSVSNAVIKLMSQDSHVVVCGQISDYNKDVEYPSPLPQDLRTIVKDRNITRERYLVMNYADKYAESLQQLAQWIKTGKLKVHETIEEGLEKTSEAFVKMMTGGNIGKQLVRVAS